MTATTCDIAALRAAVAADPGPGGSSPRLVLADALDAIGVVTVKCPKCEGKEQEYAMRECRDGIWRNAWADCPTCSGTGYTPDHSAPVEAALQRVLAQPESDAYRLAYADAVEPADKDRAELVRVQCGIAKLVPGAHCVLSPDDGDATADCECRRCNLLRQQWQLLKQGRCRWLKESGELFRLMQLGHWNAELYEVGDPYHEVHKFGPVFVRGFVEAVTCPAADWLMHADAILREHPVTKVRLTAVPDGDWVARNLPLDWLITGQRSMAADALSARWPWITFELPA